MSCCAGVVQQACAGVHHAHPWHPGEAAGLDRIAVMQARFEATAMPGDLTHHTGLDNAPVGAVFTVDSCHGRHLPAVQAAQLRIIHVVGLEAQRVRR
ncbi:hypothetical protein G6F50_016963 [Rhizopus delemar]|uniref:Uncharacterized protein n=1 Tax=Rhizopus delemar TaxID=936053 RepID=A0A9P7C190_9FUNG|nr:hypothetical protein G6F50_016963 [Rhizopus delemar]